MALRKTYEKAKDWLKGHIIDTTSVLAVTTPSFTLWENVALGFSDELSIGSRVSSAAVFYLGMGSVFAKGRDLFYRVIKQAESKCQDMAYSTLFGSVYGVGIYSANGGSLEEVVVGSLTGGVLSAALGIPIGYAVDAGRAITGRKTSDRIPAKIHNLSSKKKKRLAAGILAASLAIIGTTYAATPEGFKGIKGYITAQTEQVEDKK